MTNKHSVIIEVVDTAGKKFQKTLTDINPEATSANLRNFAQALNALTTNTFVGAYRINVTDLADAN